MFLLSASSIFCQFMAVLHCERRHTPNMDELCVSVCLFPCTSPLGGIVTWRSKRGGKKINKTLAKLKSGWKNTERDYFSENGGIHFMREKNNLSYMRCGRSKWEKMYFKPSILDNSVNQKAHFPWGSGGLRPHWYRQTTDTLGLGIGPKNTVKEESFTEVLRVWHHSL